MEELKSIRLFSETISGLAIKASLYNIENNSFSVFIDLDGKVYTYQYNSSLYPNEKKELFLNLVSKSIEDEKLIKGFNINNLTSYDYFLNDAILSLSKLLNQQFKIVQDPWLDTISKKRKYGYDPYYLNNSCVIYITWFINDGRVGGDVWSDSDGNELDFINISSDKESIYKIVSILSPNSDKFTIDLSNKISKDIKNNKKYPHNAKDVFILDEVMRLWKSNVSNYDLALCDKTPCNSIEYIDPTIISEQILDNIPTEDKKRFDLTIPLVKVRQDFRLVINII